LSDIVSFCIDLDESEETGFLAIDGFFDTNCGLSKTGNGVLPKKF